MATTSTASKTAKVSSKPGASKPTSNGKPTLQETLSGKHTSNGAATDTALAIDSRNALRASVLADFEEINTRLDKTIREHSNAIVGFYDARGGIVQEGVDCKLRLATDETTRKELRTEAMATMRVTASGAHDPSCEPAPNLDKWVGFHAFLAMFPAAKGITNVSAVQKLIPTIYRVEKPAKWSDPETYAIKKHIDADDLASTVETLSGNLSVKLSAVDDAVDSLNGMIKDEIDPDQTADDIVKPAESAAVRIATAINELKMDGDSFLATFLATLATFNRIVVPTHDGNGVSTFRIVKNGRTKVEVKPEPKVKPGVNGKPATK